MGRTQAFGLAVFAAFAMAATVSASAAALQWLLNGRAITTPVAVSSKSSGKLLLADLAATGGKVAIECEGTDKGTVGAGSKGTVTELTASACKFQSGANGECTASDEVSAKPLNLPWLTLLLTSGGITRDRLTADKGAPGWSVTCTVAGILKVTDECTSGTAEPDVANLATGVDINFLATEPASCSEGTATSGMVIGTDLIENPRGSTISVSGGAEPTTLTTKLSGESKEGTEITVLEGEKVKDKATLSGKNVSKATGKVKYAVYSEKECKTLVTSAGEGTVSGESVTASEEKELEAGKTYYWQARYEGNESNTSSTSTCGSEVLDVKAATELATSLKDEEHSGETVEASEELAVTDTATLRGTNSSSAGGTVRYKVYTEKECKTLETEAGEVTVTSGTVPSSIEETLPMGTYYWQATYSGDALHQESKSSCGKEIDTVKAAAALSTSLSGEGQSSTALEVIEGTGITDQATLNGPNASKAGGTVTYDVYSEAECKTLVKEAGKVTVTNGSVPASTEEKLNAGTYYWQATYSGDATDAGETTACGEETSIINASTSLATTLSGGGQEGETISVPEGTKMTDKATLSGTNASKAGGTVIYNVYSDNECKMSVAAGGAVTVTNGVVPSSSEQTLSPGTYYWQAFYTGDNNNHQSTSSCKEISVVKAATTLATSLSGGGRTHEELAVVEGTAVTDNATLSGENASKAGGTVTYDLYSDKECKTLVTEAGKVTVTNGSVPASSEERLRAGRYYWQATYAGDANNLSSSSACGKEILTVNKTLLATSLAGEGQSGEEIHVVNAAVHDTATLSGENASIATGKVKYDVYSDRECKTLVAEAGEVNVSAGLVPESREETLSTGTYYWQATYSGDSHNEGSTTPCDAEIAVVGPTAPQAERVEFTNDMAVVVDQHGTEPGEKPEVIEEFTGADNAQWEYSPAHKELVKSWPLAYVQETTPRLKARFELPTATKGLVLEKRIEGRPVISGHARLNGETITFTEEFSPEELETQAKNHEGYLEIGETAAISANKSLPAHVAYETMTIEWEWTIKVKGNTTNTTQGLGSSTLNLYLTGSEPPAPACKTIIEIEKSEGKPGEEGKEGTGTHECTPIYLSLLDAGVRSVEQAGARTPAEQVAAIWRLYTSRFLRTQLIPPLRPQQDREAPIRVPIQEFPIYNPGRPGPGRPGGSFSRTQKQIVSYYRFVPQGSRANLAVRPRAGCGNVFEMLERPSRINPEGGVGRCGAWAELLAWQFNSVPGRRVSAQVVRLTVSFGRAPTECNERESDVCSMLVKRWDIVGGRGGSGFAMFPDRAGSLLDVLGEAGQNNENPPPYFWDHAIVKVGIPTETWASALYDPSYGSGPFPTERELGEIRAGTIRQPSTEQVLKKYQEASIEGFCRPTRLGTVQGLPAACTQAGATLGLKAAGLTWP
jgi:hypothetical protein